MSESNSPYTPFRKLAADIKPFAAEVVQAMLDLEYTVGDDYAFQSNGENMLRVYWPKGDVSSTRLHVIDRIKGVRVNSVAYDEDGLYTLLVLSDPEPATNA